MVVSLPDARELSDEVLEALRLRALRGCQLGLTETQVAQILWRRESDRLPLVVGLRRSGPPAALDGTSGGLGTYSDGGPDGTHQYLLLTHQPEELGVAAPLWPRRAVADLIRREFDLVLAVRTIGRYLARWGFTAKRPRRYSRDQAPDEVKEWLETTYPAIQERVEREGTTIYWGDEIGVAADHLPAFGYAPCPIDTSASTKSQRSATRATCDS